MELRKSLRFPCNCLIQQGLGRDAEARTTLAAGQAVARTQGNSHTLGELTTALESLG